jgi:protease I
LRRRESDPQRAAPPALPMQAMRWIPRPSARVALGLAALLGAGVMAATRRRHSGADMSAGRR